MRPSTRGSVATFQLLTRPPVPVTAHASTRPSDNGAAAMLVRALLDVRLSTPTEPRTLRRCRTVIRRELISLQTGRRITPPGNIGSVARSDATIRSALHLARQLRSLRVEEERREQRHKKGRQGRRNPREKLQVARPHIHHGCRVGGVAGRCQRDIRVPREIGAAREEEREELDDAVETCRQDLALDRGADPRLRNGDPARRERESRPDPEHNSERRRQRDDPRRRYARRRLGQAHSRRRSNDDGHRLRPSHRPRGLTVQIS